MIRWIDALTAPVTYVANGETRTATGTGELLNPTDCIVNVQFKVTIDGDTYYSPVRSVKADTKYYNGHTFETETVVDRYATCELEGLSHTEKYCTAGDFREKVEGSDTVIPALGHKYYKEFDEKNDGNVNILKDEDGHFVLDANGNPQPEDPTENATYYVKVLCERGDEISINSINKDGIAAEAGGAVTTNPYAVTIAANKPEYVEYVTVTEDNLAKYPALANVVKNTTNGENGVELKVCSEDGVYAEAVVHKGTKEVVTYEAKTIAKHHTWSEDYTVVLTNDVLKMISKGQLTPVYDLTGEKVLSVVNNSCAESVDIQLVKECVKGDSNVKIDGDEQPSKTVTVEPTGAHQFANPVVDRKNPIYTQITEKDGTVNAEKHAVSYHQYKECKVCGTKEDIEDLTGAVAAHKFVNKKVDVQDATCTTEGSYKIVTYCEDCGYVKGEKVYPIPMTAHNYGDLEVEWVGDHIIWESLRYGFNKDDIVLPYAHRYCTECGHDEYDDEQLDVVIVEDEYTKSKFACTPDTVTVAAVGGEDGDGNDIYISKITVPVYRTYNDYYHRGTHVAGEVVTEEREDGTHKVTYCKYGCGTKMSDELVEPEAPEKTLGQVENLKAATYGVNSTLISWDALEGADGYIVVAINSKAQGQQIGYTSTTSFVDENAKSNDYNYYWVIPYFKNAEGKIVKGQLTGYKYAMGQTAMNVAAETAENGVALTWDAVDGATSYIVKAKASSAKAATVIATVTGTEYVDKTASADEFTFYWVFPCYTNAAGKTVVGTIDASQYVYGIANAVDAE